MDHLERTFRHLVRVIRTSHASYLTRPFEVAELYQTILPYRHHRKELGFETNQDYEMALLELLAGTGDYLIVDAQMRDALGRELQSPSPDPGRFREFATTLVALSPEAVRRVEASDGGAATAPAADALATVFPDAPTPRPSAATAAVPAPPTPPASPAFPPPPAGPPAGTPRYTASVPRTSGSTPPAAVRQSLGAAAGPGDRCRLCTGLLPTGRRVVFCPHCGQNLTTTHCLACGTELEVGWKFCTSCGKPTAYGAT